MHILGSNPRRQAVPTSTTRPTPPAQGKCSTVLPPMSPGRALEVQHLECPSFLLHLHFGKCSPLLHIFALNIGMKRGTRSKMMCKIKAHFPPIWALKKGTLRQVQKKCCASFALPIPTWEHSPLDWANELGIPRTCPALMKEPCVKIRMQN